MSTHLLIYLPIYLYPFITLHFHLFFWFIYPTHLLVYVHTDLCIYFRACFPGYLCTHLLVYTPADIHVNHYQTYICCPTMIHTYPSTSSLTSIYLYPFINKSVHFQKKLFMLWSVPTHIHLHVGLWVERPLLM